jgi:DNA-binding response OmpR family regulator
MNTGIRGSRGPAFVLVVVDKPVLAEVVRLALGHEHFHVHVALSLEDAVVVRETGQPHLAVIDADVGDGAIIYRFGEAATPEGRLPILALTRRGDLQTKLMAFERGADDILTHPFCPRELVARVLAILRRTYGEVAAFTPVIRFGELEIDIRHRRVRSDGHDLHLTSLEQNLLYLLAANAGRLLTRDEILDHVWGVDYTVESNVVDRHICNLRAKLQDHRRQPRYIATVPGKGYRFDPAAPPRPHDESS